MKKRYALFFSLIIGWATVCASPDLLSKIVITSKKAVCKKLIDQKNMFTFTYQGDVKVTFADASVITSDELDVSFEGTEKETKDLGVAKASPRFDSFKTIFFKDNVSIMHDKQKATADKAELLLDEKLCKLSGNVKIWQKKEKPKDIPVTIESDLATFNLQTSEITFAGSTSKPVNTVIVLAGHPALQKKIKQKKDHGKNSDSSTQSST